MNTETTNKPTNEPTNEPAKHCCICGATFLGYGNNPAPFEGNTCCDACNSQFVIPARLINYTPGVDKLDSQN